MLSEKLKENIERYQKDNQRKDDLWWALRTRPLTPSEMDEVRQYGADILVKLYSGTDGLGAYSHSFNADQNERQFNEALGRQAMMLIEEKRNAKVGE